ncbi:Rab geranylgeranyltransferase [Neonectria punicea]|uniref:protein geranylgeranyltransferase type II n=1 Tax=Neonectria punicea TaxID=979145 RepID=A0ABR1HLC1_9HYPO
MAQAKQTPGDLKLAVDAHVKYIQSLDTRKDELDYWLTEHLRLSGLYWGLTALHLLGQPDALPRQHVVDVVLSCQHENGGFGAAPGHDAHMLSTVSAVQILAMTDAFDELEARGKGKLQVGKYIANLQNQETGTFAGDEWGEEDTRFLYGAFNALSLLQLLSLVDVEKAVAHITACANFDGGYGVGPGAESHSGQIFTCVAALSIVGRLDLVDKEKLGRWLSERQVPCGGLNGRPEKKEDVCYSWWVLSSLEMIDRTHWIDRDALIAFILRCQDVENGGISDRPGDMVDVWHTLFGITGLSLLGYPGLQMSCQAVQSSVPFDLNPYYFSNIPVPAPKSAHIVTWKAECMGTEAASRRPVSPQKASDERKLSASHLPPEPNWCSLGLPSSGHSFGTPISSSQPPLDRINPTATSANGRVAAVESQLLLPRAQYGSWKEASWTCSCHLHHETQTKLKAHQDIAASVALRQYEIWYSQNGIEDLLVERMKAKQLKEVARTRRNRSLSSAPPAKQAKRKPKRNGGNSTAVKTEEEEPTPDFPIYPGLFQSENVLEALDEYLGGADMLSLKGQIWPGMGKMDLANEEMKRTRNQRKPKSVIEKMRRTSEGIEPTQVILTSEFEIERVKGVYDETSSPVPGQEESTPPRKATRAKRRKPEPLAEISANIPRQRRPSTRGNKAQAAKKPGGKLKQNHAGAPAMPLSLAPFRPNHDVFRDDDRNLNAFDNRRLSNSTQNDQRFDLHDRFGMPPLNPISQSNLVSPTPSSRELSAKIFGTRDGSRGRMHSQPYLGTFNHMEASYALKDATIYNASQREHLHNARDINVASSNGESIKSETHACDGIDNGEFCDSKDMGMHGTWNLQTTSDGLDMQHNLNPEDLHI